MNKRYNRSYFFDQGIHFECQSCGFCCMGEPGIVYVTKNEAAKIATYLSEQNLSFIETYLLPFKAGHRIKEHADGRCFFYSNGCVIYPVRPRQCATFPFWFENVRSQKKWRRVAYECPGIGRGSLYSKEQILKIIHSTNDYLRGDLWQR